MRTRLLPCKTSRRGSGCRRIFAALVRRNLDLLAALLLLAITAAPAAAGASSPPTDAQVKTAMLYNLARFVEWPAHVFADPEAPLIICWLGTDSFRHELKTLQGKRIGQHPLEVRPAGGLEEIGYCHVLVVGTEYRHEVARVASAARTKAIFTASDLPGFAAEGGMVEFFVQDERVRFTINHASLRAAQLAISAQVLTLAAEVIE